MICAACFSLEEGPPPAQGEEAGEGSGCDGCPNSPARAAGCARFARSTVGRRFVSLAICGKNCVALARWGKMVRIPPQPPLA
jgi:hypothetical protein